MTDDQTKPGVEIRSCQHCGGTGTCKVAKTVNIEHSCEYCVKKAGIQFTNPFPLAPCGYCEGKGFHAIDLKPQRPRQRQQQRRR